jgi:hypothetical protein
MKRGEEGKGRGKSQKSLVWPREGFGKTYVVKNRLLVGYRPSQRHQKEELARVAPPSHLLRPRFDLTAGKARRTTESVAGSLGGGTEELSSLLLGGLGSLGGLLLSLLSGRLGGGLANLLAGGAKEGGADGGEHVRRRSAASTRPGRGGEREETRASFDEILRLPFSFLSPTFSRSSRSIRLL